MSVTIKVPKVWDKDTALAVLDAYIDGLERGYVLTIEREGEIIIQTGLESTMGGYLHPIEGECDKCGDSYELSSRDERCGDCGNCGDCCTHKEREGE